MFRLLYASKESLLFIGIKSERFLLFNFEAYFKNENLISEHPRFRALVLPIRPDEEVADVSVDEEHDPQEVRRPIQGHLPGDL